MSEDGIKFTKQELDLIDYCLRFTLRIEQTGYPVKKEIEGTFNSILNKINIVGCGIGFTKR